MRQFVLPDAWDGGPACELSGQAARRLSTVLRLGPGDSFPAIGPDGGEYTCVIASIGRDSARLSVRRSESSGSSGGYKPDVRAGKAKPTLATPSLATPSLATPTWATMPRLVLAVGILKGSKLDDVARAATEAGVWAVVPLVTARSAPREHSGGRIERLRRVVAEALGQSGSSVATKILEPMSLAEFVAGYRPSPGRRAGIFFHETPLAHASLHRYCTVVPDEIVACVGPEGGFGDDEIGALREGGFEPAWLGPAVLRAETAAVFAVASLRIVCLERSSWSMTAYEE